MLARKLAALLVSAAVVGCGGAHQEDAEAPRHPTIGKHAKKSAAGESGAPSLGATAVAEVAAGTFGPYLGQRGERTLLAWAEAKGDGPRRWIAAALSGAKLSAAPHVVANAASDVGLATLKPTLRERFALVSTHPEGEKQAIDLLLLDSGAKKVGDPKRIADLDGEVLWIDVLPMGERALVLWAVKSNSGADLFGRSIDDQGAVQGASARLLSGARAWQAAPYGKGVAIAVVKTSAAPGGAVEVVLVDETGKADKPVLVSASPTADPDIDMVPVGGNLVLAWSDRRGVEPLVYTAALDENGGISRKAAPATPPRGEQALLRLVRPASAKGPAYLAWEELAEQPTAGRAIRLAPIGTDAAVGKARAVLDMASEDGTIPELTATPRGLAGLTLSPACPRKGECDRSARIATFVELDTELEPIATEPVRLAALGGAAAPLSWGLACDGKKCLALAASDTAPAKVFAVTLEARSMAWEPVAHRVLPPKGAHAESVVAIFAPESTLADVSLADVGGKKLAAWVTFFDPTTPYQRLAKPAPDGRFDPPRALLQTRALDSTAEPHTISFRARSLGGVALAPSKELPGQALLAWSALDAKTPQVFVTVVDAQGKKLKQKMITRSAGEKSDIAATAVADGWVVAWVDERSGDPEVYATKLNKYLQAAGPERRITTTPGAATGVALLGMGNEVLAAWADAAGSEQEGFADIRVVKLKASDASALGSPTVLAKTQPHSFSPALAATKNGAAIAWLEGGANPALMLASLDRDGRVASPPAKTSLSNSAPAAVALECADRCRVVVVVDVAGHGEVRGFSWAPGAKSVAAPTRLFGLTGPASQTVRPALLGTDLLVGDQSGESGRLRHALIQWQ